MQLGQASPRKWDKDDMEARMREVLDRTVRNRSKGPYSAKTDAEIVAMLGRYFGAQGFANVTISDVERMAGGASKEQFAFTLHHDGSTESQRLVLRMDPLEAISQTCRGREAELQRAMADVVPVASVHYYDADGDLLGQPAVILGFVKGVTTPTDVDHAGVSGIGSRFDSWAAKLAPQFVDAYVRIHAFDWNAASLSYYSKPAPGTTQAALWQVNFWSRLWRDSMVEPVPIMSLAERWLRENAPVCPKPVIVHGDLRMGNFMFEEPSGRITAILDWELAHIGDHHEDIAWVLQKLWGTWREDGEFLVCGLMPRNEFIRQYEAQSGNKVDPVSLHYYEVLNAYKCGVMDLAQAIRAAQESNNHQDIVLTWLATAGGVFLQQLVTLIREGMDDAA